MTVENFLNTLWKFFKNLLLRFLNLKFTLYVLIGLITGSWLYTFSKELALMSYFN